MIDGHMIQGRLFDGCGRIGPSAGPSPAKASPATQTSAGSRDVRDLGRERRNQHRAHTRLVKLALKRLSKEPDLLVLHNGVAGGEFWSAETGEVRHFRAGLGKGSSDIIAILRPLGRFLALEAKTGTGRPTTQQRQFLDLVRNAGGFATVFGSVDEALAAVERARRGADR